MGTPRVPPQNIEAEQSFLGSLLIDKEALLRVGDIVRPEDFYKKAHGDVFGAMLDLHNRREPIDLISLSNRLSDLGLLEKIGGRTYLTQLTIAVPTAAHVANYGKIIKEKATLRRLLEVGGGIASLAFDETQDVDVLLDKAEQELFAVSQGSMQTNFTPMSEALDKAFERIDELHKERGKLRGVPTSYKELDNLLGGLQSSDLIILAARPAVGKTSFALDLARKAAVTHKKSVGIFSLEMSKEQLVDRMISAEAGVDLWRLRRGLLDDSNGDHSDFARIGNALGNLSEARIFIDDTPNLNVMELRTKARRLQMEHGLHLLVIDYLQLMESRGRNPNDNRTTEVAEMTRALKGIARELNIPVLALSQLSRSTEMSKPAIPKLSHLRESGSIEQDADVVMFIYRKAADKNYKREEIPLEERYLAEVHVAKHRNGPVGEVKMYFDEQHVSFRDLDKNQRAAIDALPRPKEDAEMERRPMPQF